MTPPDWKDEHAPAAPLTELPPPSEPPAAAEIRPSTFQRAIDAIALLQLSAERARRLCLVVELDAILAALRDARDRVRGNPIK
jgi:hypothetical protein